MAGERLVPSILEFDVGGGDAPNSGLCMREARAAQDVTNLTTLFGEAGKSFSA